MNITQDDIIYLVGLKEVLLQYKDKQIKDLQSELSKLKAEKKVEDGSQNT